MKKIYLGGGCFWCVEAIFMSVKGIISLKSGYTGGKRPNPTYEQVCAGVTGHAEVVEVVYDSEVIDVEMVLRIFFDTHDPTTLNYQGNDVGTQYRSAIFYTDDNQQEIALKLIEELNSAGVYASKIVTEVEKLDVFYPAEEYHWNYYKKNPNQGYCRAIISPKVNKFLSKYSI